MATQLEWFQIDWHKHVTKKDELPSWASNRMQHGLHVVRPTLAEGLFKQEVADFAACFGVRIQGIRLAKLGGPHVMEIEPGGVVIFDNRVHALPPWERFLMIVDGLKAIRNDPACKFRSITN